MEVFYFPPSPSPTYEIIGYNNGIKHSNLCTHCASCSNCLNNETAYEYKDNRYCLQCFSQLYGQKCCACRQPFWGTKQIDFIYYDHKTWHKECFKCLNRGMLPAYSSLSQNDKWSS